MQARLRELTPLVGMMVTWTVVKVSPRSLSFFELCTLPDHLFTRLQGTIYKSTVLYSYVVVERRIYQGLSESQSIHLNESAD